ncbi:MAG: HNH endonuclease [Sphingomicrobium sp.]
MPNASGLSRHIPTDVARAVRERCGFGCARCAATIYEYEHFLPDFKDASQHDPDKIVLLCPTCHELATKGFLPKEQVAEISANPKAIQQGFSSQDLPFFRGIPTIKFGENGVLLHQVVQPIVVGGQPRMFFNPPESGSLATRINFEFSDGSGSPLLRVIDNEWQVFTGDWDFEMSGNRYKFSDKDRATLLVLRFNAPHFLTIEKMHAYMGGRLFDVDENHMKVAGVSMKHIVASHCMSLISI